MPKGQRKYNGAQKVEIIKQLHNEKLSFYEASSKYGIPRRTLQDWERIYLEEGEEALLVERRGRACAAGIALGCTTSRKRNSPMYRRLLSIR
jgi:transposase